MSPRAKAPGCGTTSRQRDGLEQLCFLGFWLELGRSLHLGDAFVFCCRLGADLRIWEMCFHFFAEGVRQEVTAAVSRLLYCRACMFDEYVAMFRNYIESKTQRASSDTNI